MTQATAKSDQAVFGLLTAAKNGPPVESEPIEAADYDWDVPCSFTPVQLEKLERFIAQAAIGMAAKLNVQLHEETQVSTGLFGQYYAGRFALLEGGIDNHYFALTREDGGQCGLAVVPNALARGWVGKALGGSETASDNSHEFSTLESALMRDVVVAVAEALSEECQAVGGGAFQCDQQVSAEDPLPEARDEDEYCLLTFRVGEEKDQATLSFVLASEVLTETASAGIAAEPGDKSPDDSQENLLACVGQAFVTAAVFLKATNLSMRQVMDLEVGDVLVADTRVGQPLDLVVDGVAILSGHAVNCEGKYALQITT